MSDWWIAAGEHASRRWRTVSAKPTIVPALALALGLEALGPVHLLADVRRHLLVEGGLRVGEVVGHDVGVAGREERRPVELDELLLHEPAHELAGSEARRGGVAGLALVAREPVGVEQAHEELEVLLLAVVGGRGEEEEVPGVGPDALGEEAALRLLDLVAEELAPRACGPRRRR